MSTAIVPMLSSRSVRVCLFLTLLLFISVGGEGQCPFCDPSCKAIVVSLNGTDNHTCLQGGESPPCHTLTYVLRNYEPQDNCTMINVTYAHRAEDDVYLSGVDQLAIIGESVTITCTPGVGLAFTQSSNVLIEGLDWKDCSVSHQTSFQGLNGTSALFFYQSTDVVVANCSFSSTFGAGVSLYDVSGTVSISHCRFTNIVTPNECVAGMSNCVLLGGGLLIEFTKCGSLEAQNCSLAGTLYQQRVINGAAYEITDCVFANNTDITSNVTNDCGFNPEKDGTGLLLFLLGNGSNNSFNIVRNTFNNNSYSCRRIQSLGSPHAVLTIHLANSMLETKVSLENSSFRGNTGVLLNGTVLASNYRYEGSGLAVSIDCQEGRKCSRNSVIIDRCDFAKNFAVSGAVVLLVTTGKQHLNPGTFLFNFTNTVWDSNVGNSSGAAVSLFAVEPVSEVVAVFENCSWKYNSIDRKHNYTLHFAEKLVTTTMYSGVVVSEGVSVRFSGSTSFKYNVETALYLLHATASFTGSAEFLNNSGIFGGAAYLDELAWLTPLDNLILTFEGNTARFGGAIYSSFDCYNTSSDSYCTIFGDHNGTKVCHNSTSFPLNTTIAFKHNNAVLSGNAIYLDTRGCSLTCLHGDGFVYIPEDGTETSALADLLTFNHPAVNDEMDVSLGENIFFNITSQYQYINQRGEFVKVPAVTIATVAINCVSVLGRNTYHLSGPKVIYFDSSSFFSNLRVAGPRVKKGSTDNCFLTFVTHTSQSIIIQDLRLNFVPCKLGYIYDESSQMCQCSSMNSIQCNNGTLEACIKYGHWFGKVGKLADDTWASSPCPDHLCQFNYGSCPVGPCDNIPEYCKLPPTQGEQCRKNRGGPLCTECEPGYSFTYSARLCVSDESCTVGYAFLVLLLVVGFWTMMIVGLFMILKFNLRVGSGYLYAFIYYFSVLDYITPTYLPTIFLDVVVTFFASIAKLNISFIGELPVCFFKGLNGIEQEFFRYINPLFISGTLLSAVLLARCFPRLPNPAKNTGVHAICILMLLSFSSFLETSLNLLDPVVLSGHTYVNIQAGTTYFDPRYHLPFALIAILVILLLILPFTFFMIFSPLLVRCGLNLTRLKPILDEYQSCYKDQWRWVAGYYFLCRLIVFLISLVSQNYAQIYIYQILFVVIFGLHAAIQPYTVMWLNIVDAFLLLDLSIVAHLYGETANKLFSAANSEIIRTLLIHFLILIPSMYFLCVLVYIMTSVTGLNRRIHKKYLEVKAHLLHENQERLVLNEYYDDSTSNEGEALMHQVRFDRDREPLLALLTDNGAPSAARYQALEQPSVNGKTSGYSTNTYDSEMLNPTES